MADEKKNKILLRRSSVSGKMPSQISNGIAEVGELFLNNAAGGAENFLTSLRSEGNSAVTSDYIKWSDDVTNENKFASKSKLEDLNKTVEDNKIAVDAAISTMNSSAGFNEDGSSSLEGGVSLSEAIIELQNFADLYKDMIVNVTYSELKELRDNNSLIPGIHYRITDYITTTAQENTKSAGHQFDVIVLATSASELNENAKAIYHEGDTYFSENGANLDAWELKYSLDNDVNKFAWADEENGKGVIYYMKDEWNNECPYDFKNIQFLRGLLADGEGLAPDGEEDFSTYCYTFGWENEDGTMLDTTIFGNNGHLLNDEGQISGVYENVIREYFTYTGEIENPISTQLHLNDIVFLSTYSYDGNMYYGCYSNSFGNSCGSNSFRDGCQGNSFGNSCFYNSFGNDCRHNSFGNSCFYNSFRDGCQGNSFGNDCRSNSLGDGCQGNSFGNICESNSFGNGCSYNSFGNGCYSNNFGKDCTLNSFGEEYDNNIFGNECYSNSFGNDCRHNSFGNSCSYNSFGNGCHSNSFGNDFTSNSFGNDCYKNSFENDCHSNSFGNDCYDNSFGDSCNYNSFGNKCYYNSFGNYCYKNSFGNDCEGNSFGDECYNNSFGDSCNYNRFGNRCYYNSFVDGCYYNSFGNYCYSNSFGDGCEYNSFGYRCHSNSFGNGCYNNKIETSYTYYCHFDDGCKYVELTTVQTTSSNVKLQNVNVNRGVCGTPSNTININIENLNSEKEINVDNVNGYIYILEGPENVYKTTYENLVNLRDNSQLIPGLQYRIIDYMTTTSQDSTKSANHQFDIIVTAIDDHTLSEDAKATYSENDTYFEDNNANLSAWELKYSLDNDTDKFAWAGDSITTSKEVEVVDSSNCTISIGYTYNEDEGLNEFDERVRFVSMMRQDPSNDPYLEGNDIDEVAAYWGYDEDPYGVTCLTLRGLDLEFDEETGEILSEEGISGDKWFYRGIIEVDGTEYDYWEKADPGANTNSDEIEYFEEPLYFLTNRMVDGEPSTVIITKETTVELDPKGIIYYMKDEWGNECPYDFKNIMFVRYKLNAPETLGYGGWVDKMAENIQYQFNQNSLPYIWGGLSAGEDRYWEDENGELKSTTTGESKEFYTFSNIIDGVVTDKSITNKYCYNNVIKEYNNGNVITLNNNVFFNIINDSYCDNNNFGNNCGANSFGNNYELNSFGNACESNSFGNDCVANNFGDYFASNSFGNDCAANSFVGFSFCNSFGNNCYFNSFGDSCNYNSFGNGCNTNSLGNGFFNNSLGDECYFNSFENYCCYNSFGNECYSNSFGVSCYYNSFGDNFNYNSFGNECGIIKIETPYTWHCHFDDGCEYVTLSNNETASYNNLVQNYNFIRGLKGTEDLPLTIEVERNRDYESKVAKNSLGEIKVYCEADLIA